MPVSNPLAYCIDTDEEHAVLLKHSLQKKGYTCRFFSDGIRMLRYIDGEGAKFKPSLIIIDLLVSGVGPFELAKKLTIHKWSDTVPLILTAKNFGSEDRAEAQAAGAISVFKKPVDLDQILAAVEEKKRRLAATEAAVDIHFRK
jgi:DNA-binding response OmpR family regulator